MQCQTIARGSNSPSMAGATKRLKRSSFKMLVENHRAVTRKEEYFQTVAAPVEKQEEVPVFNLLAKFFFDDAG